MVTFDHGTTGRYTQGCRCKDCKRAATSARKRVLRERRAETSIRSGLMAHGTEDAYSNHNCRCAACTAAHATRKRERNAARS